MRKQFGGKASKSDLEKYARSNNWDGKKFVNLQTTNMNFSFSSLPKLLYKQFCEKEGREPKTKLPILPFEQAEFLKPSNETKFIWYGHSALLMRMNHQTILIDPMLGPNAAPISPFSVNRFSDNTLELAEDFPEINLLLLTHDHYDHLDYESIQRLKPKVKKYFVALGVARHLIQWGIPSEDITEFDWWEHKTFAGIQIHFTPSRHFSGRGLADRAMTLWGGWVLAAKISPKVAWVPSILLLSNVVSTMKTGIKYICTQRKVCRQVSMLRRRSSCRSTGAVFHWPNIVGPNLWKDLSLKASVGISDI